jgi:hypothetical protein
MTMTEPARRSTSLAAAANDTSDIPAVGGVLCILDRTGDTKIIWDPAKQDEVDVAKKSFSDLIAKGYRAFKVAASGNKGEQIREFDPKAEKIILAPALVGG